MSEVYNDRHERVLSVLEKMAIAVEPVARSRHVAAIVYKNEILEFGINRRKSHPFQYRFGSNDDAIFLHAETDALQRIIRRYGAEILPKCSVYVARVKYDGHEKKNLIRGLSKPCLGCSRALAAFDVKNVYYTCEAEGYEQL